MNKKLFNLMFFLLVLIFMVLLEVVVKVEYCLIVVIDKVLGCYDLLKLVVENDYRWLRKDCCKVVYLFFYYCLLFVMNC